MPDHDVTGRDFALVVGVSRYSALRGLEGPAIDAKNVHDWLVEEAGVPAAQARLVVSGDDGTPEVADVESAFTELIDDAREGGARRLYFYFAGHGLSAVLSHLVLLMANASESTLNRGLNTAEYHDAIAGLNLFSEQVFFYDCCRELDRLAVGQRPPWTVEQRESTGVTQFALYACGFTEFANERKDVYGTTRGLFTQALLEGVRGSAARKDGDQWRVSAQSLYEYVVPRLRDLASAEGLRQEPSRLLVGRGVDLVVADRVTPDTCRAVLTVPADEGTVVLRDDTLTEVDRVHVSSGRTTVEVRLLPGLYQAAWDPGGARRLFELTGGAATAVDLTGGRA